MIEFLVLQIKLENITIEQIPEEYREDVKCRIGIDINA